MRENDLAAFGKLVRWLRLLLTPIRSAAASTRLIIRCQRRRLGRTRCLAASMRLAEAFRIHDTLITTVTCATRSTAKHVKIVALVITILEAIRTYGHAGRESARATPICDIVYIPDEATHETIVVLFYFFFFNLF